jgi:hypothetical protein
MATTRAANPNATAQADTAETQARKALNEELKKLRFSGSRTAFDIDIDALEEHPWSQRG